MKRAKETIPEKTAEKKTVLTSEEAAIVGRVMATQEDWKKIKESEVDDFQLANDPFELPEPAKELKRKKKFAFRWIERTTKRMDEMRNKKVPFRWWVCNAVETPFLKGFFDPVLGCVCNGDQMLVFKPYWMYEKEQGFKQMMADRNASSGDLKKKHGEVKGGGEFVEGKEAGKGDILVIENVDDDQRIGDIVDEEEVADG
jgi:hypothetical protein